MADYPLTVSLSSFLAQITFTMPSVHTNTNMDTTNLWFGYPLIILGVVLLVGSVVAWVQRARFLEQAMETRGVIVGYASVSSVHHDAGDGIRPSGRTVVEVGYRPVIEFTAKDGRLYRFTSRLTANADTPTTPPVLYLPNHPQTAQQKHFFAQTGWVIILTSLGFLLVVGGLAIVSKRI